MLIPAFSNNKDAAWEFVKFCCSGNKQDPAIGKAWVEGTGQPARASLLKEYAPLRAHFPAIQESLPTAVRYPPMPETLALYDAVGNEVAAVVTRREGRRGGADRHGRRRAPDHAGRRLLRVAGAIRASLTFLATPQRRGDDRSATLAPARGRDRAARQSATGVRCEARTQD